ARNKPVMNSLLVSQVTALRDFDRIDFTNQIGDRDVRSCKFFGVAVLAANPVDLSRTGLFGQQRAASPADRIKGIVVDFTPGDRGNIFIEQAGERTDNPGLGLAPLS